MKIERKWAMPNASTFHIKPIGQWVESHLCDGVWVDPFVGRSPFKSRMTHTNDLNPTIEATHHMGSGKGEDLRSNRSSWCPMDRGSMTQFVSKREENKRCIGLQLETIFTFSGVCHLSVRGNRLISSDQPQLFFNLRGEHERLPKQIPFQVQ